MKRAVSLILTSAAVLALGTTAFAAEGSTVISQGNQEIDVEAKYESSVETPAVYSVDVSWGAMQFSYAASGTKDWNADSHTYTDNKEAGWTAEGNTVRVTNHSNAQVTASFTFEALDAYPGLSGSFDKPSLIFPSAENKAVEAEELTAETVLGLEGALDGSVTEFTKIGTITVVIQ